jgi:hypothetical protein
LCLHKNRNRVQTAITLAWSEPSQAKIKPSQGNCDTFAQPQILDFSLSQRLFILAKYRPRQNIFSHGRKNINLWLKPHKLRYPQHSFVCVNIKQSFNPIQYLIKHGFVKRDPLDG